jgi:hypothetical protein
VTGPTIDLTNTILSLTITPSAINGGEQYTILSNPNPITGTFVGAAEGGTITVSGKSFTITYQGGTSHHDVVLTAQSSATIVSGFPALNANPHNLPQYAYIAMPDGTSQHSMVESVVYSFSSSVTLAKSDFTITNKGPANIGGFDFPAFVPDLVVNGTDNNTLWTVTFANHPDGSGGFLNDGVSDDTHSIGDGRYELVLNKPANSLSNTYDFWRLIGDVKNKGIIDGDNFQAMVTALNQNVGTPQYRGAFDFNNDGFVSGSDFQTLVTNFSHTVGDVTGYN